MLHAVLENGTRISMADKWHENELNDLRKQQRFICPICQERVILKLGTKRQWHFSHEQNHSCRIWLEPESAYHLQGKLDIYKWLRKQGVKAGLEVYLPVIQQRPDVICKLNGKLYAIEYQCSSLSEERFLDRTNGYNRVGIIPIWILGGNRLRRKQGVHFQIQGFEWLAAPFSPHHGNQKFLIYFCPETKRWARLDRITSYSSNRAIASLSVMKYNSRISVEELIAPTDHLPFNMSAWLKQKKKWRTQPMQPYSSKSYKTFSKWLYIHRIPPGLFPAEAGWFLPTQHEIVTSPHIWQSFLLIQCFLPKKKNERITLEELAYSLTDFIMKGFMVSRENFKQSMNKFVSELVYEYAELLTTFHILKKINSSHYVYQNEISILSTYDEAIKRDQFLSKLKHNTPNLTSI
ncbi:competence protein CoiA [Alkalicoccobacillus porphyridii]|nr:competence protein CoiA family protein [Alkalicoccobacillus porphyridii]